MRIAVIGTGGIGGPYGASLAKAGADVTARRTSRGDARERAADRRGSRRDQYPAGAGHPTISRALASSMSLYNPLGLRDA